MTWKLTQNKPIYQQLAEHVELDIIMKKYDLSEKLPSVRDLALEAGVNPNTMQRALTLLEDKGLVYSERTAGRFITSDSKIISDLHIELANNYTELYFNEMKSLGFSTEEILTFINKLKEEENE